MRASIKAIDYYLPEQMLTNAQLTDEFPDWSVEKIQAKTGIIERHIAAADECASDLAVRASERLFSRGVCRAAEIAFVILCTQSPDYFLPSTACLLQERLGIPTSAGALDTNLGCSGFIYGLALAKGMIEAGIVSNVLLITAETYSKHINPSDRSVRTIFGDAAAATFIEAIEDDASQLPLLGPFVLGTDGKGAPNLIVPGGGMRMRSTLQRNIGTDIQDNNITSDKDNLFMDGPEIFNFTIRTVPNCIRQLLEKAAVSEDDVDLFVFHQANQYMLEHLRRKMKIAPERFYISLAHTGNTVSASIPIALREAQVAGRLHQGDLVMAVGFGVGYSWGATLIRWNG